MTKEFEKEIYWAPVIDLYALKRLSGIDPFECEFMQLTPNDSYVSLDITTETIADLCDELEFAKSESEEEGYIYRLENEIKMRKFLRAQLNVSIQEILVSVYW